MTTTENKIKIVAAILDHQRAVFYKEDGTTVELLQGDTRLAPVMEQISANPDFSQQKPLEITIPEKQAIKTVFDQFSEQNPDLVQFIRVATSLLERIDAIQKQPASSPVIMGTTSFGSHAAIQEIMANALPVVRDENETEDTTMVAVMGNTYVAGAENLSEQLAAAMESGSPNMVNFFNRLKTVAARRNHSAEDLLAFIKAADLPIAADGSIIAYKVLESYKSVGVDYPHDYVDCHTKRVGQQVGDIVSMDESMVDPDRRQDCSNGLHIARRGYLGGFGGDIIVLTEIAPEDVIAVPQYDHNKVRVCAYRILAELPQELHETLRKNQAITQNAIASELLSKALNNQYPPATRRVVIGGHNGTKISIVSIEPTAAATRNKPAKEPAKESKVVVKEIMPSSMPSSTKMKAPALDVSKVANTTKKPDAAAKSLSEKAKDLLTAFAKGKVKDGSKKAAAQELADLKKASKKSWVYLGVDDTLLAVIQKELAR